MRDDKLAFPASDIAKLPQWAKGMTLREYYAGQALPSSISETIGADAAAVRAVKYADALIAELSK